VTLIADYSSTGERWERGPGRLYNRMAEAVVERVGIDVAHRLVLDVGAGTGAATRALLRRGARVVAIDAAQGMLAVGRETRPPAAVADACLLPFPDGAFAAVVAAFTYNHLAEPALGLREAVRVLADGGTAVAAHYGIEDHHPVKPAVEGALREAGWEPPAWYERVRCSSHVQLATEEACQQVIAAAGVRARVLELDVSFPELGAEELVEWRLGAAHAAPFVAGLSVPRGQALRARALELMGPDPPVIRRPIVVIVAQR
jgi:SAM-dependent methyltransferase